MLYRAQGDNHVLRSILWRTPWCFPSRSTHYDLHTIIRASGVGSNYSLCFTYTHTSLRTHICQPFSTCFGCCHHFHRFSYSRFSWQENPVKDTFTVCLRTALENGKRSYQRVRSRPHNVDEIIYMGGKAPLFRYTCDVIHTLSIVWYCTVTVKLRKWKIAILFMQVYFTKVHVNNKKGLVPCHASRWPTLASSKTEREMRHSSFSVANDRRRYQEGNIASSGVWNIEDFTISNRFRMWSSDNSKIWVILMK